MRLLLSCVLFVVAATAYAAESAPAANPVVIFETNAGPITIEVMPDKAPVSAANFLKYVESGFYDGTIFHRVIPGFVIQGGGFTPDMSRQDTRAPIINEADNGLLNTRGTLSMARTSDPLSATSQFFVNLVNNTMLDYSAPNVTGWGYAVFAKVIAGIEAVDAVAATPTGVISGMPDVPQEAMIITKATLRE